MSKRFVASIPQPPGNEGWTPCFAWCHLNLYHGGHYEPNWSYCGEGVFEFTDEKEYTLFMLRWA